MLQEKHFHRRNLPHLYYNEGIYFVTFRLYDSIHPDELDKLQEITRFRNDGKKKRFFKKYDALLDKPFKNVKHLQKTEIAEICTNAILHFDGKDILVICFVIMPNHIHLVFELVNKTKLVGDILGSIKKYSAREANKILKRKGKFWQAESFDRLVRDEKELFNIIKYVLLNPVNAGLVEDYNDWPNTYCRKEYLIL
jgi:REP element-mobilizing transposase RayT